MADLSVTTTQVKAGSGAKVRALTAAEAMNPGQTVSSQTGGLYKFDANDTARNTLDGIAVSAAGAAGQHVSFVWEGDCIVGTSASVTKGMIYLGSLTQGGITPCGDTTNEGRVCVLGYGKETSSGTIYVSRIATGVDGDI